MCLGGRGELKFIEKPISKDHKDHVLYGPTYMAFLKLIIIEEENVRVIGVGLASILGSGYENTSRGALW